MIAYILKQPLKQNTIAPADKIQLVLIIDAEISPCGDVTDAHRVGPVDESSSPLGTSQFQTPQRAGLRHY